MKPIPDKETEALMRAVALSRPTYSTYLFFQLYKIWPDEFEVINSHYTARGMMAHIIDKKDGQKYTMEIYPDE